MREVGGMKYGLLTYKYPGQEGYRPKYVNIGDYIQSIAARQFLPSVDVLIDRDSVASYSGEPIKLIMNGWWHLYEGNEVTSDAITPLYVAYHIANPESLTSKTVDHLKKHAPIGCRDLATMNFLQDNGVEAYLSSCLTLTLGKTYYVPENERTNTVYFVDCDVLDTETPGWRSRIKWWIKRCLARTAGQTNPALTEKLKRRTLELIGDRLHNAHIEKRKHYCCCYSMSLGDDVKFQIADQLLRDYSKAKLVVTSRLHCALPVLSMGVPVLFVGMNLDDKRYAGALDWVSQIGLDQQKNFVERLSILPKVDLFPPPMKAHSDQLIKQCQQFVSSPIQ